jgi:two-component system, NarL family, nitrate/nitrite response regulator NarL
MKRIKVLLVDSEVVYREGLTKILKGQPDLEVYEADSAEKAVTESREIKPDFVLIDSQIGGIGALEAVKEITSASPETNVAVLSRPETGLDPADVFRAGGRAIFSRISSADDIVKAIELVSSGRIVISPLFAEKLLGEINSAVNADNKMEITKPTPLTEREMEVVRLIAEGATNKEIAQKLFIAEYTVKVHVKNILRKLDIRNRQQLVATAILQHWITANDRAEKGVKK